MIGVLEQRWSARIVLALGREHLRGPLRFGELMAAVVGISDRVLTTRLRQLQAAGVVTRLVDPGPPVRVLYGLTPAGLAMFGPLEQLAGLPA